MFTPGTDRLMSSCPKNCEMSRPKNSFTRLLNGSVAVPWGRYLVMVMDLVRLSRTWLCDNIMYEPDTS